MAEPAQQRAFTILLTTVPGESDLEFGNITTVLGIMERCWASRQIDSSRECDWRTAMAELGICALLV
jgi:hypothetical protein